MRIIIIIIIVVTVIIILVENENFKFTTHNLLDELIGRVYFRVLTLEIYYTMYPKFACLFFVCFNIS